MIFALPPLFRQDEPSTPLEKDSVGKRALYAASRILITPGYSDYNTFDASELLGRAMAQEPEQSISSQSEACKPGPMSSMVLPPISTDAI